MGTSALGGATARLLNSLAVLSTRSAREEWLRTTGPESARADLAEAAQLFIDAASGITTAGSNDSLKRLAVACERLLTVSADPPFPSPESIEVARAALMDFGVPEPAGGWEQ